MMETIVFAAIGLGIVLIAGMAIVGRTRSRAVRPRESDGFDPGPSHMWFSDTSSSSSGSSDCSPSDAGCDSGGGSDGGGGGGGSD